VLGAAAWGRWAAPRSSHRLRDPRRLYFEQVFFAAAVAALAIAGAWLPAALLAVAVTVNAVLMQRWEQRG